MALPTPATKTHLDAGTDDPKQARLELAGLVDAFNALLTHLGGSSIVATPLTIGEALEAAAGALQVKLDGGTLARSASGLKLATPVSIANGGTGAAGAAAARTNLGLGSAAEKAAGTLAGQVLLLAANNKLPALDGSLLSNLPFKLVQVVHESSGATATGTTQIPADDSIPQITEGTQFLSAAITPQSATNRLIFHVHFYGQGTTNVGPMTAALFQSGVSNALAAGIDEMYDEAANPRHVDFMHEVTAGSTAARTYTVRAGMGQAGTLRMNGAGASRRLGGVLRSSITIWEVKP